MTRRGELTGRIWFAVLCAAALLQAQCAVPSVGDYADSSLEDKIGPLAFVAWSLGAIAVTAAVGWRIHIHNKTQDTKSNNQDALERPQPGEGARNPVTLPSSAPSRNGRARPNGPETSTSGQAVAPAPSSPSSPSQPQAGPRSPSTSPAPVTEPTAEELERAAVLKAVENVSEDIRRVTRRDGPRNRLGAFCEVADGKASKACADANLDVTPRLEPARSGATPSMGYWLIDAQKDCLLLHATQLARPDGAPGYAEVVARVCLDRAAPGCYTVEDKVHDANFPVAESSNTQSDMASERSSVAFIVSFKPDGSEPTGQATTVLRQLQLANISPHDGDVPNSCLSLIGEASASDAPDSALVTLSGCSYSRALMDLARRSGRAASVPEARRPRVLSCEGA